MTTIRLGLIADTHLPSRIPTLPYEALEDAFRTVDAILHAGDIETQAVLDHLSGIAPILAVRGDDDRLSLPMKRVLQFGDVRVGLVHGHRHPLIEGYFRLQRRFGKRGAGSQHLLNNLTKGFADDDVDVIVFGHLYKPMCIEHNGIRLFNPGAVYAMTLESAQWQLIREQDIWRRQMLNEHIQRYQKNPYWRQPRSTVGILEIGPKKQISTYIVDLPLVAHY
jgi:uncharacterized protein